MGMVVTGTSIAMIFGLPMGRFIGLAAGWRMTFACVAVISFATLAYLFFLLPKVSGNAPFAVKDVPKLFRNKVLSGIFLLSFLVSSGYYTCYSYIEPFMPQISHFPADWITMLLTVFGFAGLLGSLLSPSSITPTAIPSASTICLLVIALSLFYPLAGDLYAICALCVLWGMAATAFNVGLQAETIRSPPALKPLSPCPSSRASSIWASAPAPAGRPPLHVYLDHMHRLRRCGLRLPRLPVLRAEIDP